MQTSRGTRSGFFLFLLFFYCFRTQAQATDPRPAPESAPANLFAVQGFSAGSYRSPSGEAMAYRLFVPPDYDAAKKYPIVLWLHGAAGRGSDNYSQVCRRKS